MSDTQPRNRLSDASSPYLRSAAHQPVNWYPWCGEAFEEAKRTNRPILLDIGAVWCHWCHVIDRESYDDPETAHIINELYVPVKVDRDERPDVDARYQQAVAAITSQGGWPLTGFLTPEGDLFWGGTYFPPRDAAGRPGFPRVLQEVAHFFAENAADARKQGDQIRSVLERTAALTPDDSPLRRELVDDTLTSIRQDHDIAHGGFGAQPKFPHPSAVDLLLYRWEKTGEEWLKSVATSTLTAMARGGVYDQLGDGFHRYSVDERWVVPHFEKMLYDNAGLFRNYVWAYAHTGDERYRETALGIVAWADTVLSDRARGGFYASQDADIGLDDDGDYWTWTEDEAKAALDTEEFAVAQRYWDIYARGEMRIDPTRNVLFVAEDIDAVAAGLKIDVSEVRRLLASAKRKLRDGRARRKAPYVDETIYVSWNGMMIVAYLDAARLLDAATSREFALTTLDRLLAEADDGTGGLYHRLGGADSERTATLDDQVQIGLACLAAFETTGDPDYLARAESLAATMTERFQDQDGGGFFDSAPAEQEIAFLKAPVKPIQDSPCASANACAVAFFEKLGRMTEKGEYRETAERTLRAFSKLAPKLGLFGAAYFVGLEQFLDPPPVAVIVGPAAWSKTRLLRDSLLRIPRFGAAIVTYDPDRSDPASLPEAVRGMLDRYDPKSGPVAYICSGTSCSPPTSDPEEAAELLRSAGRG